MIRREFFGMLFTLLCAARVLLAKGPIGPLTVERHRAIRNRYGVFLRVFVRGVDVTDRCRFADDTPGSQCAELYKVNVDGRKYLEDNKVAVEIVYEDIEIREGNS